VIICIFAKQTTEPVNTTLLPVNTTLKIAQ